MSSDVGSFDYTTDVQRLMDDLRDWLTGADQTVTPNVIKMMEAYGVLCRELNDRLRRCQEYLRLNLWSEAIQLSEIEPNLPNRFSSLWFDDLRSELMDRCSIYEELDTPPSLLQDIYEELNEGYEHHVPLERLFAKHRLFNLRRTPLKDRLKVVRSLASRDEQATFWEEDVIGFERARIEEIKDEARGASGRGDKEALTGLRDELESPDWFELPNSNVIQVVKKLINQTADQESRERLPELTESLAAQWEYWGRSFQEAGPATLSVNPNWVTVVGMLNEWFETAEKLGVLDTDPQFRQVAPIDEAVRALEGAAKQAAQQAEATQLLRHALRDSSTDRARLERLYGEASRWGLVPADLREAYERAMKSRWWRANWERVVGAGIILTILLAGVVFLIMTNNS